jgi:hypothetical protein
LAQRLDRAVLDRARRAFQAVYSAEHRFDECLLEYRRGRGLQLDQTRCERLQVLLRLGRDSGPILLHDFL